MDQEVLAPPLDMARMRKRLSLAAVLWLALVALLGAGYGQYRLHNFRDEVGSAGHNRLNSLQGNVENHFQSLAALGKVLARQDTFIEFLRPGIVPGPPGADDASRARLRALLSQRADVQAINAELAQLVQDFQIRQAYVQDAYATAVADSAHTDTGTSVIGANFRTREYFISAMEHGAGFQFVMGKVSHKLGFNFSTRIDDGSRALGILILKTDPASMARMFTDSTGRILCLVDRNGVVVAGNRPELLIKQIPDGPDLSSRAREIEGAYRSIPSRLAWQGTTVKTATRQMNALDIDGQRYLLQTRPLNGYPYALWVLSPLAAEAGIQTYGLMAGVVAVLAGWVALWSYQRRATRREAVEQGRREALEMTRALPLTLFRYRVSPDGKGRFSYIGPGVNGLFGIDEAALRSNPQGIWERAGCPDARPPLKTLEFPVDAGAHQRWISANSAVSRQVDGSLIYDGYWLDVTDRRQAEQRFEAAFNNASSAFFFFHRERGILRCNPATLALFGVTDVAQIQGVRPWLPPFSPPTQPDGRNSLEAANTLMDAHKNGQHQISFEWQLCRDNGTSLDVEAKLLWLGHEDRDLYFAVVDDLTARKQTEAALKAASIAAQQTTMAKSAFLANMSHEIRTPMNAIIGMTHLALDDCPPDKLRSYVQKAHQAANSLLQIINDILDMSKIEAGHLELECIEFDLQTVIDQVANVLGLPAEQKSLELLFSAPPDLPRLLVGDPTRLRQILVNLGSNAIKFTDAGSVTMGMEVQHRHEHEVVLHGWVRDTGIGMSAEQQTKLFKPFSQVDVSTTRRFGGTGLGLTIAQQLAERMHGRLWVDSVLNAGSTFHFTVRMGLPEKPDAMALRRQAWVGRRLLLVDDNADARQVLGQMASSLGLSVDFADSGEAALAQLTTASQPYEWILIDWKMPGMDGVTCARHIHELMQHRFPQGHTCILLVTAFNREDALSAAQDTPLADVLTKPVTPSTLFQSLARTIRAEQPLGNAARLASETTPLPRPEGQLQGLRILLVEDQPMNQELASALLSRAGASVVIAGDGQQALQQLEADAAFDCVLMDCQMPHMDGYTTTERIRSNPHWRNLPIIAMTASALLSDRARALASGMNDHITKPLDVAQMYQVVQQWATAAGRPAAQTGTDEEGP